MGVAQRIRRRGRAGRVGGEEADAGAQRHLLAGHRVRPPDCFLRLLRPLSGLLAGGIVQQYRELVTAEAGQGGTGRRDGEQPVRDLHQHLVTDRVADGVVDVLEPVQVEQGQGVAVGAGGAGQRPLHPLSEHDPVGQSGQWVVQRLIAQLPLQRFLLADRLGEIRRTRGELVGSALGRASGHPEPADQQDQQCRRHHGGDRDPQSVGVVHRLLDLGDHRDRGDQRQPHQHRDPAAGGGLVR